MKPTSSRSRPFGRLVPCSRALRHGALALALLQIAIFAVLPVADAVLEAEGLSRNVHVESEGSECCDTGHNHQICQLVRAYFSLAPVPVRISFHLAPTIDLPTSPDLALENGPTPPGGSGSRAPPLG